MGSTIAIFAASYNLYQIQQTVIKQAIHLTKSTNTRVIKFVKELSFVSLKTLFQVKFYLNMFYFGGLLTVWHVPSLSVELGWHVFQGVYAGTLNYLIDKRTLYTIFESKKQRVLMEAGIITELNKSR